MLVLVSKFYAGHARIYFWEEHLPKVLKVQTKHNEVHIKKDRGLMFPGYGPKPVPYVGYIGMCGIKVFFFSAVLVIILKYHFWPFCHNWSMGYAIRS